MNELIERIETELNKTITRENDNLFQIQKMNAENSILCKTRHQLESILELAKKEEDNYKAKKEI